MPPKCKFTKDEIVNSALNIVRKSGFEALTARSLAAELNSSPKPIFGVFQNMYELQTEVLILAKKLYNNYISDDMASGKYPPYKASGMAYIRFAKEEKELFKLLFMRDRSNENTNDSHEELRPFLEIIKNSLNLSEDDAFIFHIELWVFVHGIATMIATSYLDWDMDFVSAALTDTYNGLKHRFTEGKN